MSLLEPVLMPSCVGCGREIVRVNEICHRCYLRHIANKKQIRFLRKKITLAFNPHSYVCSKCNRSGETQLHHWFYVPIMPWACTTELCLSCHNEMSWKIGHIKSHPRMGKMTKRDPVSGRFKK